MVVLLPTGKGPGIGKPWLYKDYTGIYSCTDCAMHRIGAVCDIQEHIFIYIYTHISFFLSFYISLSLSVSLSRGAGGKVEDAGVSVAS